MYIIAPILLTKMGKWHRIRFISGRLDMNEKGAIG